MRYRRLVLGAVLATVPATVFAQQPAPQPSPPAAAAATPAAATQAFDPKVARRITADEVKKRMDAGQKVIVIDTRGKVAGPIVKGSAHVPSDQLEAWAKDHPKDAFIVAYCT